MATKADLSDEDRIAYHENQETFHRNMKKDLRAAITARGETVEQIRARVEDSIDEFMVTRIAQQEE